MIKKFFKGFVFAFNGLSYAFSSQLNFKVHLLATIIVVTLGYHSNLEAQEWLWITAAISLVLVVELINTSVELLVDLISPDYNPKAGLIKDLSAGAVLITSIMALLIGLIIFIPKYA